MHFHQFLIAIDLIDMTEMNYDNNCKIVEIIKNDKKHKGNDNNND